nr:transporter substrate-binding domain-containing protein [Microvirga massiliensis]
MAGAAAAVGSASLGARQAAAQAAANSQLRTVLDRGKLLVGTGSTNAPWHFENEKGELVGMDIAMARILAKGLFDDESKVEFVRQDPAQRIPNINTGKVDIVIQFMTVNPQRAQLVHFTRPYYVEGVALLVRHDAEMKTYDALMKAGSKARISILQNADADTTVKAALPQATILQLDTQANVIQAIDSRRADAAAVDLSTVQWITKRQPDRYADAGKKWYSMLYSAALRQGDPDWLRFVNTTFEVAMYGHQNAIYDKALQDFFGLEPPVREPGLPRI